VHTAYREFCKGETIDRPAVDLGDVIDFYNQAAANLPDHDKLKDLKLPGASVVLDRKGKPFAEVFEENQRTCDSHGFPPAPFWGRPALPIGHAGTRQSGAATESGGQSRKP
jgi:hypothetical protein